MRKYLAATAALSGVLLLAACSDPDQSDDATPPAASETSTEASASPTPTVEHVETVETCAGYFDGDEHSTSTLVSTWGPRIGDELDDDAFLQVTVVRDRISSLLFYANEETTPQLQAIRVPFENALTGTAGSPSAVKDAVAEFRTTCKDAGFKP